MPTYGEKWRARSGSSACASGHVPRSWQTPFLRLDSTGEISTTVDNSCQANKTRVSSTPPREVNGNMISMKNWVTSSVMGVNGLRSANNLTNSGKNSGVDFNANILDRLAESMPTPAVNMNPNMPKCPNNILYPQGGTPWNYPGHNFSAVNGRFPMFPCHQYNNPFVPQFGMIPQQGKMEIFACPEYLTSMGKWTHPQMMDDHHWHQRHRKFDRSYRGHAPKHHKHDHAKHDKKTFPSEQVPSKSHGKGKVEREIPCTKSGSESPERDSVKCNNNDEQGGESIPKVDASMKCKIQVKPEVVSSPVDTKMCDKTDVKGSKVEHVELTARVTSLDSDEGGERNGKRQRKENPTLDTKVTVEVAKPCKSSLEDNKEGGCKKSDQNDRLESNLQVLFIRKNWKKGRPSASKQRRRKLQKAKTSECGSASNAEDERVEEGKTQSIPISEKNGKCHGTMSFILGLAQSPETMPNCQSGKSSFVFAISDDDQDDDEDDGSDFDNHAEWEAEFSDFAQCDLFNFLPQNNSVSKSPINFQVQISPIQTENNSQEKTMEDINSTWNIQISVLDDREKCKQKKKTSKKVHFPEDKDLSVVHPMVTWAYAYQEARKGHWENFVRDRDRFQRRVKDLETVLNPVLAQTHRDTIYTERFQRETNQ